MFLAKLRGRRGEHQIIMQEEELSAISFYKEPNILEVTKYDPEKTIEINEWFYVEMSEAQMSELMGDYLEAIDNSSDLNHVRTDDYEKIEGVYKTLEHGQIIFTKITKSYKVRNRRFLKFHDTEDAQLETQENSIIFTGAPDAYFDGEKKLYFKKYETIRPLFPGIEQYFREATKDEIEKFLNNSFLDVDQNITPETVGQRAAKKIASILDDSDVDIDTEIGRQKVLQYAENYPEASVEISEISKLVVKDNKGLGAVLNLLSSKYYTSELTGKKMQSFGSTSIGE